MLYCVGDDAHIVPRAEVGFRPYTPVYIFRTKEGKYAPQ